MGRRAANDLSTCLFVPWGSTMRTPALAELTPRELECCACSAAVSRTRRSLLNSRLRAHRQDPCRSHPQQARPARSGAGACTRIRIRDRPRPGLEVSRAGCHLRSAAGLYEPGLYEPGAPEVRWERIALPPSGCMSPPRRGSNRTHDPRSYVASTGTNAMTAFVPFVRFGPGALDSVPRATR